MKTFVDSPEPHLVSSGSTPPFQHITLKCCPLADTALISTLIVLCEAKEPLQLNFLKVS